jgi:hypothetical protein
LIHQHLQRVSTHRAHGALSSNRYRAHRAFCGPPGYTSHIKFLSKPAKRAKAKTNTKAKSREAKATAMLEKAWSLLGAGKRKQSVKRLLNIVRRYPKTKAAVEAFIILAFTEP